MELDINKLKDVEHKCLMASGFKGGRRLFSCSYNESFYFKIEGKNGGTLMKTRSLINAVEFYNDTEGRL